MLSGGGIMDRFAIFVDAGYLFAQGSALLAGGKQPRSLLHLKLSEIMTRLVDAAREHSDADSGIMLHRIPVHFKANIWSWPIWTGSSFVWDC